MNINQNRALYIGWVRTVAPQLYDAAVLGTVRDHLTKSLRGLGDDGIDASLIDPSAFDTSTIDISTPTIDYASSGTSNSIFDTLSNSADNIFSTIVNAVPQLANTYVQSQGQLNLLNINTQRAKQGLPPLVNMQGTQVTAAQLAPANAATLQMEQALSSMGNGTGLLLMLGVGVLALVLLAK